MKFEEHALTVSRFRDWLNRHDGEAVAGKRLHPRHCPLAMWLRDTLDVRGYILRVCVRPGYIEVSYLRINDEQQFMGSVHSTCKKFMRTRTPLWIVMLLARIDYHDDPDDTLITIQECGQALDAALVVLNARGDA